jgi:D-alanyl-D-alanine carboxypeptidase (penicillin-binding protein 5/6)
MGGSQLYLEEGEQMTVEELLKSVAVASANDDAVALGRADSGQRRLLWDMMNARAKELGMNDTVFANCSGCPTRGSTLTYSF